MKFKIAVVTILTGILATTIYATYVLTTEAKKQTYIQALEADAITQEYSADSSFRYGYDRWHKINEIIQEIEEKP